jgi:YD repeat-containing protein
VVNDALNRVSRSTYNTLGDVTSVTDAAGATTTFGYDANGNRLTADHVLTSVTPVEHETTTWHYDDATHPGDVTSISDPLSHATTHLQLHR